MKISTRLALAGLTFALPVAMLFWFMDLSFRHDLGIGRTELAGTAFMRKAFEVMRLVPEHRVLHLRADAGDTAASAGLPEVSARVFAAIKDLQQAHEPFVEALRNAPGNLALKPDQTHPHTGIQSHWRRVDQGGQGYAMLLEDLAALMREAEGRSLVALDPVLDSHALGSATVGSIPGFLVRVSSIETLAASHAAGGRVMHSRGDDRDMLVSRLSLLKADLEAIMRFSATALDEDSRFYTTVASMERDFRPALDDFRQVTGELTAILERLRDEDVPARDLMDTAHKARLAGHVLLDTGLDALDDMIRARVASYRNWQLAGAAVSGAAMLLSVLIGTAAIRRVTRSVHNVAEFARRVGDGDYNAQVECGKIPELFGMAQAIQRMVGQLKEQIGSLYGVLQGMTVPCLAVDTMERLTFINQPYLDLYERGGKPADYLGMTVGELFYGDKNAETHTGRCLREGRPLRNIGIESVTPSGRRVSVRYDVAPVHDLDGVLIGAFALIIDMTEIKDQQREIERLAAFPEVSPIPTLSVNADGSVAYANRAAERAIQNLGLLDRRDFLPDNHEEVTAACLASGQNSELEYGPGESTFLWNYHPLPDQGRVHVYASDITARKRAERQILHDAFHDALTGLPNKALFMDRLEQAALRSRRNASRDFAVLLLDMDDFKHVNDSLGHAMGDKLLMEVAARLGAHLRDSDTLARLGGDEFGIIMEPLSGPEQAMAMARRIAEILADPFAVEHNELWASAAVGIVFGGDGRRTADELLRDADTAMFRAKAKGKGEHSLFDDAMHKAATDRLEMETALKRAVDNGEFVPFYQPLVDLATGRITGFEALVRWHRPGHGLVPPGRFIPLAEETGLVVPIGAFMLEAACRQATAWQGLQGFEDLTMSVNMAVRQMVRPGIVDEVAAILEATGVAPSRFKIEVTESGIMENMDAAVQVLQGLKDLGVRLAIDDFGTGYSSLAHLHRFPFDYLKVDQSFVTAMETAPENREIIETIVGLGHSLGKTIIAEGVETDTELAALRAMGCEIGQGYLFARPLPAEDAEAMLRENPAW